MTDTVTLTKAEYRDIWNARCSLSSIISNLEGVLAKELIVTLRRVQNQILNAQQRAQDEIDSEHDRRNAHYSEYQDAFPNSIWSMYEVENLEQLHPYNATYMEYDDTIRDITDCKTWLDLWRVADELIKQSGTHHIFIEGFSRLLGRKPLQEGILILQTGS